jgi:hypothetical protein
MPATPAHKQVSACRTARTHRPSAAERQAFTKKMAPALHQKTRSVHSPTEGTPGGQTRPPGTVGTFADAQHSSLQTPAYVQS